MNAKKVLASLFAAAAAGLVALIVFNLVSHKNANQAKPPPDNVEVLVAATKIEPGIHLNATQFRWQFWPRKNVDPSFIQKTGNPSVGSVVDGFVSRTPMMDGEPLTYAKIVKSQGGGIMSATIAEGKRAFSIPVKIENIVGGFVQPNNRVDVLFTRSRTYSMSTVVPQVVAQNVRVLAIDQNVDGLNQKVVSEVRTVTLELTPEQVGTVSQAHDAGDFTLSLRSAGDDSDTDKKTAQKQNNNLSNGAVLVIRYGKFRKPSGDGGLQ